MTEIRIYVSIVFLRRAHMYSTTYVALPATQVAHPEASAALQAEGAETHGLRSERGLGITQFVSALLRLAHTVYPEAHLQGVG